MAVRILASPVVSFLLKRFAILAGRDCLRRAISDAFIAGNTLLIVVFGYHGLAICANRLLRRFRACTLALHALVACHASCVVIISLYFFI